MISEAIAPFDSDAPDRIPAPDRVPFLSELLARKPPPTLFHYTSPAALDSILRSRTVRASAASFLNDAKEQRLAVEIAATVLKDRLGDRPDGDDSRETRVLGGMISSLSSRMDLYMFSLSARPDDLSQWRAYCPGSGGYSIGFSSAELAVVAAEQGFYLAPCVYDYQEQYALLGGLITFHLQEAGEPQDIATDFARSLWAYSPILKHRSFKAEEEWRLISRGIDPRHEQVGFHERQQTIVPHFDVRLTGAADPFSRPHFRVTIGPSRDPDGARKALNLLLLHHGLPVSIGASSSPYRGP